MPDVLLAFGLVAAVLIVTALVSGLVERSPLSFPLLFLGLGLLLGEQGLGVLRLGPRDPILEIIATVTLSLVLFLDAVKLQIQELGRRWLVPFLVLGPGTILIILFGAGPFALLFGFGWIFALLGGAVLASTDPVVLREIVRNEQVPRSIRQVLKVEAGMNDIVVLPIILVLIAIARGQVTGAADWVGFLLQLLVVGPVIGFAIGGFGAWLLGRIDGWTGIRLEHQAFAGIGLVLAAYSAATIVGGNGFLASFAAGLAVVVLNQRLCECFLEYGEVTAELLMLLAFVLFGAVLGGLFPTVPMVSALILAALIIFVIRPVALGLVLARVRMSREAHIFVAWFGARGLSSLLLALLVVQSGVAGAELLLTIVGVVVLASVIIHGATATPVSAWYGRRASETTLAEERESTAAGLLGGDGDQVPRITADELYTLLNSADPPLVLDVRSRSSYERDEVQIPGSVRIAPDHIAEWAMSARPDRLVVAYCT